MQNCSMSWKITWRPISILDTQWNAVHHSTSIYSMHSTIHSMHTEFCLRIPTRNFTLKLMPRGIGQECAHLAANEQRPDFCSGPSWIHGKHMNKIWKNMKNMFPHPGISSKRSKLSTTTVIHRRWAHDVSSGKRDKNSPAEFLLMEHLVGWCKWGLGKIGTSSRAVAEVPSKVEENFLAQDYCEWQAAWSNKTTWTKTQLSCFRHVF